MLQKIDAFASKQTDEATRTNFGGLLSVLTPLCFILYIAQFIVSHSQTPPVIETDTYSAEGKIFSASFKCLAPNGCFMTLTYSNNSRVCAERMRETRSRDMINKCTVWKQDEERNIDFCYTSDPIDGISFTWERSQKCQLDPKATIADCRSAVILQSFFLNYREQKAVPSAVPLFAGIHVFTVNNVTSYMKRLKGRSILQISNVHTSEEAEVDSTNLCCGSFPAGTNCPGPLNPGNVNDAFQLDGIVPGSFIRKINGRMYTAKIRTFPIYQDVTISDYNVLQGTLTAAGSFWSILLAGFGIIATLYQKLVLRNVVLSSKVGKV